MESENASEACDKSKEENEVLKNISSALSDLSLSNGGKHRVHVQSDFVPRQRAKSEGDSHKPRDELRSERYSASSDNTVVEDTSTSASLTTIGEKSDNDSTFNSPDNSHPPSEFVHINKKHTDDFVPRPGSLSLPKPQKDINSHKNLADRVNKNIHSVIETRSHSSASTSTAEVACNRELELDEVDDTLMSKSMPLGHISKKGEMIEFVADDLQEMIRQSSPHTRTESSGLSSRTSSLRSLSSVSSSAATSGMSRSPSSQFLHSPDDMPPIDPHAVLDLETHARRVADSLDLMMGNLKSNLHKMSAITVGCLDAYKTSVDVTCDSVDCSIKAMYAMMAKCEELSNSMRPVYKLSEQIKEIKRLLDRFEQQLAEKNS